MGPLPARRELSASQIAAQAAIKHHQSSQQVPQLQPQGMVQQGGYNYQSNQNQHQTVLPQHSRQRSQTVPAPGQEYETSGGLLSKSSRSSSRGPLSPPLLSVTEASAPRESGFGGNQGYHNGLLGSSAAAAAANIVFPRSGQSSPKLPPPGSAGQSTTSLPVGTTTPTEVPDKPPLTTQRSKVKLFSRPVKIGIKTGDPKEKPLPSPGKALGQAFSNLQRGNFSTTSLDSTAHSFYSLANSSAATIKAVDTNKPPPVPEKEGKEKKHHFLSRQKHKLKDKDDFHLPLSSASSNSRPTDPSAPSSLYNFSLPPSPGPNTGFKKMSDLAHGKKKKEEKFDDAASSYTPSIAQWTTGTSLDSASIFPQEPFDSSKFGLNNMTADDAWPFLRAKMLGVFEGEDLRVPYEDLNRIVRLHIEYCIARRSPNIIVEDLRDLLHTGFASLDYTLRSKPENGLTRGLVDMWMACFTHILPAMQAVFLPLDMEFTGQGTLMTPEQAREFWGGVVAETPRPSVETPSGSRPVFGPARPPGMPAPGGPPMAPASAVLEVRRIVLYAFRDIIIVPRYETLKGLFSQGVLSSLASMSISNAAPTPAPGPAFHHSSSMGSSSYLSSSPADSTTSFRPGTASLDPGLNTYSSTGTTLLGESSSSGATAPITAAGRPRGISNLSSASYGSGTTDHSQRPFTPSSFSALNNPNNSGSSINREQANAEDSKAVTEMVSRMLQCLSVIASVGYMAGIAPDEGTKIVEELNKLLKLNWLGRGRTGRNRMGLVGGRVRRGVDGSGGIRE